MYNDYEFSNKYAQAHGANEINLHVKEMEKKMALSRLQNLYGSAGPFSGVQKMTRRLTALLSSLFLG